MNNMKQKRNCRGCTCSYIPSSNKSKDLENATKDEYNLHYTDDWQSTGYISDKDDTIEAIGFCDHCDIKNPVWFDGDMPCRR